MTSIHDLEAVASALSRVLPFSVYVSPAGLASVSWESATGRKFCADYDLRDPLARRSLRYVLDGQCYRFLTLTQLGDAGRHVVASFAESDWGLQ